MHRNPSRDDLRRLLTDTTTIAVVGASSDPYRPSNDIMRVLLAAGYEVIPVNPNESSVLGQRAYPALHDVPVPMNLVNVFRRIEEVPGVADAAVAVGAKALWLQMGLWSEDAAERASRGGLVVVMDECIKVVHRQLGIAEKK